MKNPLVSVNILTYDGEDLVEQCLKSVLSQTYQNIEILVIDNNSNDNTIEKVREIQGESKGKFKGNQRVIENGKNLGFAAGHNLGIRESRGEHVFCLNQDVVLDKDFVKYGIEVMEKDEKIGAVQGKLYKIQNPMPTGRQANTKTQTIDTTGLVIFKNRRVIARGQGEEDKGQYNKAEEIFGVDGAAPLYRRSALEDTKINDEYFDEDFFCYKEDVDLAWRLQLYGWKSVYESRAIAYHLRGAGERAVKNYISVALARRKISQFAKFYSFKNDRLMRIKNELPSLFFRHFFSILIKEIGAWAYVLFFEHYIWRAIRELIKQIPSALRKRKIIMANKRISIDELKKWFQ